MQLAYRVLVHSPYDVPGNYVWSVKCTNFLSNVDAVLVYTQIVLMNAALTRNSDVPLVWALFVRTGVPR